MEVIIDTLRSFRLVCRSASVRRWLGNVVEEMVSALFVGLFAVISLSWISVGVFGFFFDETGSFSFFDETSCLNLCSEESRRETGFNFARAAAHGSMFLPLSIVTQKYGRAFYQQ